MDRLWQPATVVSSTPGRVRLQFDRLDQCQRCLRGEGCGAGVFSQLFARRHSVLEIPTHRPWAVGQRVRVGVMPARVVRGALLLYGFPLAGFLIGAATGHLVAERIVATSALGLDLSALVGGLGLAALTTLISWRYRHDLGNPAVEAVSCDAYAKRP